MKKISVLILIFALFPDSSYAEKAIFAGGCFWCSEADFEKLDGVMNVVSGYTGGTVKNPDYAQVTRGDTGHYEAVEVDFNPQKISYIQLLEYFWQHIDPLDAEGQFCARGNNYRSAIFTNSTEQYEAALASRKALQKQLGDEQMIATVIQAASTFYPAEAHHQNYYKNNPVRYQYYRWNCDRDARLKELWGK